MKINKIDTDIIGGFDSVTSKNLNKGFFNIPTKEFDSLRESVLILCDDYKNLLRLCEDMDDISGKLDKEAQHFQQFYEYEREKNKKLIIIIENLLEIVKDNEEALWQRVTNNI